MRTILNILFLLFATTITYGQLGFCTGSKGDPIFTENFGTGTGFGPALPAGTTSYTFINGTPNDGQYTLHDFTQLYDSWHNSPDHTPNDTNGKSLIVNASYTAGEFYERTVTGLCVNTTFEFTAYLMNVFNASSGACGGASIPINVTFEIWDITDTVLLAGGSTNDINAVSTQVWTQYGLTFTTPPGQTSVILKMINNSSGGCGNDLAIDDILFRSCGDVTTITSPQATGSIHQVCDNNLPVNLTLNVNVSNATPHVFQWQESDDNITWTDIPGENNATFNTPALSATKYYRVKVAQDVANLANTFCLTLSDPFSIVVIPQPVAPASNGDFTICSNDPIPSLAVTTAAGESVDWFDAAAAGNLLLANSSAFTPTAPGNYYAEAYIQNSACRSATRTLVTLTINAAPVVANETAIICENGTKALDAGITGVTYAWSTGETTQVITVFDPGIFTVTVTNPANCSAVKTITVTENLIPVITNVLMDGNTVTIITAVPGDYSYSLDGNTFQQSNVFFNVTGGLHTVSVHENNFCGDAIQDFLLILVPNFFTPNNDSFNDFFKIEGLALIPNPKVYIFDRYGKMVALISQANPEWNGMLNGSQLPSSDYWYRAVFENGKEYSGHFSLKR